MQTIKAGIGQSIFDLAIQHMGSVEAAFDIAHANGLAVDAALTPGQQLKIAEGVANRMMVDYYTRNNIHPATALTMTDLIDEGVGYWIVGDTFIVN